jgi:hypothetical protein
MAVLKWLHAMPNRELDREGQPPIAEQPIPDIEALTAWERVLLFCVGSGTNGQRIGIPSETVTEMTVQGLVARDALGRLTLKDRGRATLRALLPDM